MDNRRVAGNRERKGLGIGDRVNKDAGIHSRRHRYATHILEKTIGIRYTKDLLYHFDIETTERYLHVKREQLVNIASHIDDLCEKGKIEI